MKPISKCKAGDIITDKTGNKCKVLGRLDSLIFRSEYYNYDVASYRQMTVAEAEKEGWKVLTKDGRTPMTLKEIEDQMFIKITK